ncbi:hypothetical protein OG884_18930 [Streptosporangium sp. NBC_01755]|nr:hypothetical protein [Streptosporangium sp. NBC_01755]WSD01412.1 hypothetical protein OG884_05665 [Streptosporangium sp. NBC_01755]WSD03884.1 hypothetical protein OG884_18930 [Streptosporangium sp. NBC_01755]
MAYDFPPDLIEAQRAYDEVHARVEQITDAPPPSQETTARA